MGPHATLVATLTSPPEPEELSRLSERADWLEVRADQTGPLDPDWLRSHFAGALLYTLRSRDEGGSFEGSPGERRQRLAQAAAAGFDLIDLEGERDLEPGLIERIEPRRRVVSWHGPPSSLTELRGRLQHLAAVEARLYKLVPAATQSGEELAPLALLSSTRRDDLLTFAGGALGVWTRLIAPRLGAPVVYGATGGRPGAAGQPTLETLCADYGLPELPAIERVFGIVGNPAFHSLSPRLHNGIYRALGVPATYLAFEVPSFGDFWLEVVERGSLDVLGMPLRGLSVTTPFKEIALVVAGASSPLADRLNAANTLVRHDEVWEADTTDPEGVVAALRAREVVIRGRRAVVVGVGAAGRSAAAGLALAGARVTLANRTVERGRKIAADLRLPFVPLRELDSGEFEILVNATALGRDEDDDLPFDITPLGTTAVVLDLVYRRDGPTRLVSEVRRRARAAVDGREVLLFQAVRQLEMMTGEELPLELGRRLLGLEESP